MSAEPVVQPVVQPGVQPVVQPGATSRVWCVADAMSCDPLAVESSTGIGTAIDLMLTAGRSHVVVVDARGVLLDIVPLQVLSTAVLTRLVSRYQPIGDAVVAEPPCVHPTTGLDVAVEVMLATGTDAVGVVDQHGRVEGVLTWPDVGRAAAQAHRPTTARPRGV